VVLLGWLSPRIYRVLKVCFSIADAEKQILGFRERPLSGAQPVVIFLDTLMTKHPGVSQFSINRYTVPGLPS